LINFEEVAMSKTVETIRTVGPWQVPALGAGTWALGGRWTFAGLAAGWGDVDDEVSIAAIRAAYEGGVRLIDTADAYGCGHAERVLGKAIAPFRDDVVIATKVGLVFDEATRSGEGIDVSPAYIRRACEASLRRLGPTTLTCTSCTPARSPPTRHQRRWRFSINSSPKERSAHPNKPRNRQAHSLTGH
jgi:diketogulonate reductase-like aldo/keto reductase